MIPDDITPIDDRLLGELLLADAALGRSAGTHGPGGRSWLDDCARLIGMVWPAEGAPAAPHDGAPTFGRFEILREVGRGGFGIVYLARDPLLGRDVALKVPLPDRLAAPEARRRFMREARAAAILDHPHIVPVFEADELGPYAYIAAAYVAGPSLSDWLRSRTEPGSPRAAAAMVLALAGAVQHAHERGILHRDLKPSNVLLQPPAGSTAAEPGADLSGLVPRLTDFGLAKLGDDDGEQTRSGVPLGSPPYMAPEQAAGRLRDIGPPTDVYALGATLYEVLTGRPPFRGETPSETIRQVLERDPVAPRVLRPDLPRDLETICLCCLHKAAHRRYPSAAALAVDLARFLEGRPILARPAPARERLAKWGRRRPASAALAALGAFVAIAAAGGMVWSNAWLRAHNERLRQQMDRADHHAREAERHQRIAEEHEALADRHLHAARLRLARQAYDLGQFERAQEILLDDAYGPGPGYRDFAWWHLWRLSRREVALLGRHQAPVRRVDLSPDGRTLASCDAGGGLILWDTASGRPRATISGHAGAAEWLAFAPDGRLLASCGRVGTASTSPSEIVIWDVAEGCLRARPEGIVPGEIRVMAFLGGGRLLAVVARNPDGTRTVRVWDLESDAARPRLRYQVAGLGFVMASPDGRFFAARETDGRLTLRDPADGRITRTVAADLPDATALAVSRDGQSLAAAAPGRVLVWHLFGERPPRTYRDEETPPHRLAFSPDGSTLVAVTEGRRVVLRDLETGRGRVLVALDEARDGAFQLAFSPDGARLAVFGCGRPGDAMPAAVWRLASGVREKAFPGRRTFQYLAFAADGASLYLGGDHELSVWRPEPADEIAAFASHRRGARAVACSPDGATVASGGGDEALRIWDPNTGRERAVLAAHGAAVAALAFRPDGRVLASAGLDPRDNVRLWDSETGRPIRTLSGHAGPVRSVAFSPTGDVLASAGSDHTVRLWDAATGASLSVLTGHEDVVRSLAFSPDGRALASASNDRTVRLWDVAERRRRSILPGRYGVAAVAFSPDGKTLASADESGFITLRDPDSPVPRLVIHADDEEIRALAFSPAGHTLASAGVARTVRLWDHGTGQELLGLDGSRGQVNALAFSPAGHALFAADHAGFVRIYRGIPE
jgi:WD40 repeat protein